MRNLMWKDWKQNQNALLAVLAIVAVMYVIPPMAFLTQKDWSSGLTLREVAEVVAASSYFVTWLTALLLAPAIAGSFLAGERASRSSQFAAYLPIPRGKAVASRFISAFSWSGALLIPNAVIAVLAFWSFRAEGYPRTDLWEDIQILFAACTVFLLMFGLGCLWSSVLNSPAFGLVGTIGTAAALAAAYLNINNLIDPAPQRHNLLIVAVYVIAPIVGLIAMAAGAVVSSCRREL